MREISVWWLTEKYCYIQTQHNIQYSIVYYIGIIILKEINML